MPDSLTRSMTTLAVLVRCRLIRLTETVRSEDGGGTAEQVVLIAIFVALAIAAGAIITDKVMDAANNINMGT